MRSCSRHLLAFFLVLCALLGAGFCSADATEAEAENLTGKDFFTYSTGFPGVECLYDGVGDWGVQAGQTSSLSMASDKGIAYLSIRFGRPYATYTITDDDTGTSHEWNQKYLHDFIDLEALFGYVPKSVTLTFGHGSVILYELTGFSSGKLPDNVQRWEEPKDGETDLVLFSTHCDDEHLFFAGVLPYYAGERNYQVQLVYLTDHVASGGYERKHEALDGLWAAGVHSYPVWGEYYDYPVENLGDAYRYFNAYGWPEEHLVGFAVEQLRRFKPTVAIGHDFNGEYGHGQHMVWADVLAKASEISGDAEQFPESADTYGAWDVPKTYIHLYEENPIVMDWDQPLNAFDGMTAWEVSVQKAFRCHVSQIATLEDADWYFADNSTAASVVYYSPREYGLYRTTVGEDVKKNDFFENTTTYAELNGTATVMPTEPEETTPADATFPTEPSIPETMPQDTTPETQPQTNPADEAEVTYPVWPFLVIAAAVAVAVISLLAARKEKQAEK